MDIYQKSLCVSVLILLILASIFLVLNKLNPKPNNIENFISPFGATIITKMSPREGDSSTIVEFEGENFNQINKVYFKNKTTYGQCVVLGDRNNNKVLKVLPPPMSELGISLKDVRDNIIANQQGFPVQIIFVQGYRPDNQDFALTPGDENAYEVPKLNFRYIDRIPYKNNCALPPPQDPTLTPGPSPEDLEGEDAEELISFPEGSDLDFLMRILPEKEKKLNEIYQRLNDNLDKYNSELKTEDNIEYLQKLQAMENVKNMKQNFNQERYQIYQYLQNKF